MKKDRESSRRAIVNMSNGNLVRCDSDGNEKDSWTHASISHAYWVKCVHCGKIYRGHTVWAVRHLEKAHGIKWWRKKSDTEKIAENLLTRFTNN